MSYDLWFDCGPIETPHNITGGTYQVGGSVSPWLNITWNYGPFFRDIWPEGIRALYGKTAEEVIAELERVLPLMSGKPVPDYWAATEGNAKKALMDLLELAKLVPKDSKLAGN